MKTEARMIEFEFKEALNILIRAEVIVDVAAEALEGVDALIEREYRTIVPEQIQLIRYRLKEILENAQANVDYLYMELELKAVAIADEKKILRLTTREG
jgi:hypothetical protein